MIEVQRLTGMRPGEVCMMQPADLDASGAVWTYKPSRHKTAWRGKERDQPVGAASAGDRPGVPADGHASGRV